jgi:hypothetical protein
MSCNFKPLRSSLQFGNGEAHAHASYVICYKSAAAQKKLNLKQAQRSDLGVASPVHRFTGPFLHCSAIVI